MFKNLRKSILKNYSDESGASLIEFAFVAPLFFLVVIGGIEFMAIIWEEYSLNYILSKGARYAFVHSDKTEGEIIDFMSQSDIPLPNNPKYTVDIDPKVDVTLNGTIDHKFVFYPSAPYKINITVVQPLTPN